jgi:hypothetical protein
MSAQLAPEPPQRRHRYAYAVGELFQEPFAAESVWPCVVVPEIAGRAVFAGGSPATTAVWLEVAGVEP